MDRLHAGHAERLVAAEITWHITRERRIEVEAVALHTTFADVDERWRLIGDAEVHRLLVRVDGPCRGPDVELRDVLEVQDERSLRCQRGVHPDEVARTVEAGAVMTAARHEDQRPLRLILGLHEVPRHRHEHREAVRVVARGIEPAVRMGVDDDVLPVRAGPAGDDAHRVLPLQAGHHLGVEPQLNPERAALARGGRLLDGRLDEPAVGATQVEAGCATVAEVADVHVAGLLDDVQDGHGPALGELSCTLHRPRPLRERAGGGLEVLHGDLALHVHVRERRIRGEADIHERRAEGAAGNLRAAHRQRALEDDVATARAEARVGDEARLPGLRPPEGCRGVVLLYQHVAQTSRGELLRRPRHRSHDRRESRDPAPDLVAGGAALF